MLSTIDGSSGEKAKQIKFYRDTINGKIKTKKTTPQYDADGNVVSRMSKEITPFMKEYMKKYFYYGIDEKGKQIIDLTKDNNVIYDSYGIDRKTGDLMFTITLDQSLAAIGKIGLTEWQPLLLQRLDRDYAETVGFIRTYNKNKEEVEEYDWGEGNKGLKLRAKLFEDNEEIYNKILDGTLQASDLQFIIDQMK